MNHDTDALGQRGRAMEEAFFRNVDAQLLARLKTEAGSKAGREELIRKTGVEDQILVDELVRQGITAEGLVAMRMIPLVLVAWADREVTEQERKTVLDHAHEMGIQENEVPHMLLEHWLSIRPSPELGDAWRRYTLDLMEKMNPSDRESYVRELKREMTAVAKASGGILGIGKISHSEHTLINMMVEAVESL
jgi:hypothetical protein